MIPVSNGLNNIGQTLVESEFYEAVDLTELRTGLDPKPLQQQIDKFEKALNLPNLSFVLGISSGDLSVLLKYDNKVVDHCKEQKRAKLYMALVGIESLHRRSNRDQLDLKECIRMLGSKLVSDTSRLEELIRFIIAGKSKKMLHSLLTRPSKH